MISVIMRKVRTLLAVRAEAVKQIAPADPFGTKENPTKGQEKEICDDVSDGGHKEETSEQEFQKATDALRIDGGATLHTSQRHLKRWA